MKGEQDMSHVGSAGAAESPGADGADLQGGVDEEFDAAEKSCAVVDVSSYGRLRAEGKDTLDLLHRLSTADLRALAPGGFADTLLLTAKGRLVDLLSVWAEAAGTRLIVSPGAEAVVTDWIARFVIMEDVRVSGEGAGKSMLFVVGPEAGRTMADRLGVAPQRGTTAEIPGGSVVHAWTPRWKGYLIHADDRSAAGYREQLTRAGHGRATPMGWPAFEAFRIARRIPARGTEITDDRTPYDIAAMEAVSTTKGCYIGQEVVARMETYQKVRREPTGFILSSRFAELPSILSDGGERVGELTSQAFVHGQWIGLGVVRTGTPPGTVLTGPEPELRARVSPASP